MCQKLIKRIKGLLRIMNEVLCVGGWDRGFDCDAQREDRFAYLASRQLRTTKSLYFPHLSLSPVRHLLQRQLCAVNGCCS